MAVSYERSAGHKTCQNDRPGRQSELLQEHTMRLIAGNATSFKRRSKRGTTSARLFGCRVMAQRVHLPNA